MLATATRRGAQRLLRPAKLHIVPVEATRGAASAANAPPEQDVGRSGWRYILLVPAAFAGFLGCWQVGRYSWKVDMLDRRLAGLQARNHAASMTAMPSLKLGGSIQSLSRALRFLEQAEPCELESLPQNPAEYTRLSAKGTFQHDKSVYVGPRPRTVMGTANPGYTLITPLIAGDWHNAVLVNRGWVPANWRSDPSLRATNSPEDLVALDGVVRASEARSRFVPDNEPAAGQWYWIDVPAIARACDLPPETPLMEVYGPPEDTAPLPTPMDALSFKARAPKSAALYPIPKPVTELMRASVTPTDHRNYALTWFALSGLTSLLAVRALRKPARRRTP